MAPTKRFGRTSLEKSYRALMKSNLQKLEKRPFDPLITFIRVRFVSQLKKHFFSDLQFWNHEFALLTVLAGVVSYQPSYMASRQLREIN